MTHLLFLVLRIWERRIFLKAPCFEITFKYILFIYVYTIKSPSLFFIFIGSLLFSIYNVVKKKKKKILNVFKTNKKIAFRTYKSICLHQYKSTWIFNTYLTKSPIPAFVSTWYKQWQPIHNRCFPVFLS